MRSARIALPTREQVPRSVTTSLPADAAGIISIVGVSASKRHWAVRVTVTEHCDRYTVPFVKAAPFEFCAVIEPSVLRAIVAPGNPVLASLAATLITPVPVAGEP